MKQQFNRNAKKTLKITSKEFPVKQSSYFWALLLNAQTSGNWYRVFLVQSVFVFSATTSPRLLKQTLFYKNACTVALNRAQWQDKSGLLNAHVNELNAESSKGINSFLFQTDGKLPGAKEMHLWWLITPKSRAFTNHSRATNIMLSLKLKIST